MKKLLLVVATILSLEAKSQTSVYHPFPDSNAVWCYGAFGRNCAIDWTWLCWVYPSFQIGNDTIINTVHYKILHDSLNNLGYIRQDTSLKKVYVIPAGDSVEYIAYNDNWQVGDTLDKTCLNNRQELFLIVITSVDSLLIHDGTYRKIITANHDYGIWVQGIGLVNEYFFGELVPPFEVARNLLCFNKEGNCKFNTWENWPGDISACNYCGDTITEVKNMSFAVTPYVELYPNPVKTQLTIRLASFDKSKEVRLRLIDALGQVLHQSEIVNSQSEMDISSLPSGFYLTEIDSDNIKWRGKFIKE